MTILTKITLAATLALPACPQSGIDLAIPESPAAAVLGLTSPVSRPATPRELAVSLLNGTDAQGNPQNGLSLDLAPYWLAAGARVDRRIYRTNRLVRLMAG